MRIVICLVGAILAGSAFSQQVIEWNYNNQAAALGNGCDKASTQFISAGNEMSVVFSNLGISLTGRNSTDKVAKKACRIVIPTKVRAGYYLATLNQKITYGYERTGATEGQISAATEFYGQVAGNLVRQIPTPGLDQFSVPFAQVETNSLWRVNPNWCLRRDFIGNFKATLGVNGYRADINKDIVVQVDGHDIRFDAVGTPALCQ